MSAQWFNHPVFVVVDEDSVWGPYDAGALCKTLQGAHYSGEEVGTVYVAVSGELRKAEVSVRAGAFDDDDYAHAMVTVDGSEIGGYRIDGRA